MLEVGTETCISQATSPIFAIGAALITVAAQKFSLLGGDIAEARDVDAVGAIAEGHLVLMAGHDACSAAAHVVVHEIVAKFAAAVGEAVGKFGSGGVEQDPGGFQRGST